LGNSSMLWWWHARHSFATTKLSQYAASLQLNIIKTIVSVLDATRQFSIARASRG
jgi:hypothetical protein